MLQLVKRLAGLFRSAPKSSASSGSPSSEPPSWRPGKAPAKQGEEPKRFSTLVPEAEATPNLEAAGLVENKPEDESK